MRFFARIGAALALTASCLAAQPRSGDFAVAFDVNGTSAIGTLDRAGTLTTLVVGGFVGDVQRVRIAPDNRSLLVLTSDSSSGALCRVSPTGAITTLYLVPPGPWSDFLVDQDGSVIVTGIFYSLRLQGPTFSQLPFSGPAILRDPESTDIYVAPSLRWLDLLRFDRETNRSTRAFSGSLGLFTAQRLTIEYDATTGGVLLAGPGLWRVDAASQLTTMWTQRPIVGLRADPATDDFFVADGNTVFRMEPSGRYVAAWGNVTKLLDFDVWGAGGVVATGVSTPGSSQRVSVNLPDSPGAAYALALSFAGRRPGIALGSRVLRITPDPLFFATLGRVWPGITSRFTGQLDALGRAEAAFTIHDGVPRGSVYTLGVAAINSAKPDGLDVAVTSVGVF